MAVAGGGAGEAVAYVAACLGYAVADALDGAADGGAGTGDGGVDCVPEGVEEAHCGWYLGVVVVIFGAIDYGC